MTEGVANSETFSSGFDLKEQLEREPRGVEEWRPILAHDFSIVTCFCSFPKPTIAAVRGHSRLRTRGRAISALQAEPRGRRSPSPVEERLARWDISRGRGFICENGGASFVPKRMKEQFPTVEALMTAAVFDVAGVMLELLSAQPQTQYVVSRNAISAWAAEYGQGETKELIRALSEAWAWLESNGFIADELSAGIGIPGKFVTRAARNVRSRADFLAYARASLLPREILREDLAQVVLPLFLGGHFDAAVGAAFVQLQLFVRRACDYPDGLAGVPLMRRAFHPNDGPLTDREAVPAEREAAMHLFSGAMVYHENAFRHRVVGLSRAAAAASLILFANELLAQADAHARGRKPSAPRSLPAASEPSGAP